MFLSDFEIRDRLHNGELTIEPFVAESLGAFAVDLRLGTEVCELPGECGEGKLHSLRFGEQFHLAPRSGLLAVTLESIGLSLNLLGLIFPRASHQRIGMSTPGSLLVEPGYAGRLVLAVDNVGRAPIVLRPGMKLARLALAEVTPSSRLSSGAYEVAAPLFDEGQVDAMLAAEAAEIEDQVKSDAERVRSSHAAVPSLEPLVTRALAAKGQAKGEALQELAVALFSMVEGLRILKTQVRLAAEELDLVLQNDIDSGFWRTLGSPIVVECKNWSRRVGAREVSVVFENLESLTPDAKTGILIAPNGVSGNERKDAKLKIREKRQRGRYLLVIEREDLLQLADGVHPAEIIERKYNETLLI